MNDDKDACSQVSEHEIRVYEAVRTFGGWMTAREIAVKADVANRTARHHTARLADREIFDVARVFGGFRYRIRTQLSPEAGSYAGRIEAAKRIFAG